MSKKTYLVKRETRLFLKTYGKHFRDLRLANNLTQVEVAEMVECSQAIISHIENGLMLPPTKIELALIEIYN